MFDVGFSELLLIAVVALVVFGPDRLPKLVRETSYWIRKIRGSVQSARTELDREFQLMELRASMDEKRQQFLNEAQGLVEDIDPREPRIAPKALIDDARPAAPSLSPDSDPHDADGQETPRE
jgi:sec-independent protein translocase protein TatB